LEDGALNPISNEKVIDGNNVFFWHKNIDDVVVLQLQLELKHCGPEFLSQFDVLDVILGGDHGERRFQAAVKLIFRCRDQPDIKTLSTILQVGHIDTSKDTYDILEQTIAPPLNEGMRRIINKFAAFHQPPAGNPIITLAAERPEIIITEEMCWKFGLSLLENWPSMRLFWVNQICLRAGALGVCFPSNNGAQKNTALGQNGLSKRFSKYGTMLQQMA
jgi:hypothetical protein